MEEIQKLPVGIDSFTLIREHAYLYVDKTAQLENLVQGGKSYFLSRPQGFGKTVMLSTLTAMFSGKTEYFKGLACEEKVKEYARHPCPVMNFDFSILDTEDFAAFTDSFMEVLDTVSEDFDIKTQDTRVRKKISTSIKSIYEQYGPIVLLIDNYDKPIIKCFNNREILFKVYQLLQSFYATIKIYTKYICFLMITGEEKYTSAGVFSTIERIQDISSTQVYDTLLGFTQNEFETNFSDWISYAASKLHIHQDNLIENLKKQSVANNNKIPVYHPSSILKYFNECEVGKYSFLYETGISGNTKFYNCLNKGDKAFLEAKNSQIYVDKSELLIHTNSFIETDKKYICISRPRRFGKTTSVNMVAAYYDETCNAEQTFKGLKITNHHSFYTFANKYIVIKITIQDYLSISHDIDILLKKIQDDIIFDLLKQYGTKYTFQNISMVMESITLETNKKFVIVIDEWDCILRESGMKDVWQKKYLDFLRYWLKDKLYIALVYMTGILPIKKYGTHSALNMFNEYSMLAATPFTEFIGFTEYEVKSLCNEYNRDFNECKKWYDGYKMKDCLSIYNPRSVNQYISTGEFGTYWNSTETYESLRSYIKIDRYGIHDAIINLLAGASVPVRPGKFTNDMAVFQSQDDILTLLVHLGYLSFDAKTSSVHIPNKEITEEFVNAIDDGGWPIVVRAIDNSVKILSAILNKDCETVAQGIEDAHLETSILSYNDENALACTLSLALYAAREQYTIIREFPSGKGFADLVLLPRPNYMYPLLLIELKWNKDAPAAIQQIHERNYPASLLDHSGEILLVGITYDKKSKKHTCHIESFQI